MPTTTTTMNACWKTMALCVCQRNSLISPRSFARSFAHVDGVFFQIDASGLCSFSSSSAPSSCSSVNDLFDNQLSQSCLTHQMKKKQRRKTRSRSGQSGSFFFISFYWLDLAGLFAQVLVREREREWATEKVKTIRTLFLGVRRERGKHHKRRESTRLELVWWWWWIREERNDGKRKQFWKERSCMLKNFESSIMNKYTWIALKTGPLLPTDDNKKKNYMA